MIKVESVQPYKAIVGDDVIFIWSGSVPIWSKPTSVANGAIVVDEIKKPIEATVLELQKDTESCRALRARICYGDGRSGWVLYDALVSKYNAVVSD